MSYELNNNEDAWQIMQIEDDLRTQQLHKMCADNLSAYDFCNGGRRLADGTLPALDDVLVQAGGLLVTVDDQQDLEFMWFGDLERWSLITHGLPYILTSNETMPALVWFVKEAINE